MVRHLTGWNRSIWPMQSIGKTPVNLNVLAILQKCLCASLEIHEQFRGNWPVRSWEVLTVA